MKKLLTGLLATSCLAAPVLAENVKIGLLLGYTGPAESYAPPMDKGANLAFDEINASGLFLGGKTIEVVTGDSTCTDAAAATTAAERLVTAEKVVALVGALCSGATGAILQNVARPNGMLQISPSATSPALTAAEDDGLFFRTAPSDARQGQVIAEILKEEGISSAAVTYTNNDYGKGLADAIQVSFEALGGTVTINAAHEDGKGDYTAEVGALSSAGGEILIVAGYLDQGGKGIVQAALDTGAFDLFFLPDAMVGPTTNETFGSDIDGSIGTVPGTDSNGAATYTAMAEAAGYESAPYSGESYDAAALTALAMQAAGTTDSAVVKDKVYDVANAPGEKIFPGELAKGLQILADGGDIDYVGATAVELIEPGEAAGGYRQIEMQGGVDVTTKYR